MSTDGSISVSANDQVVLARCGIDIRGRGKKLRINYRTTEELKNWALGLLKGLSFDDLDAGADDD